MKEFIMKHKIAVLSMLTMIVFISSSVDCSQYKSHTSAAQEEKIAALKDLRDTGVITEQEYEAKVQALQAQAAPTHAFNISWSGTRKVEIADPQYQMTAYTLEIPSNWKFAGTIARDPGCHSSGASLKYTLQTPDGQNALVVMPGVQWTWTTSASLQKIMASGPCPAVDIDSSASFLVNIAVPNLHPNAKIVSVLPLAAEGQAALADQLAKMQQQNAAMARQYGQQPQKLTLDGARVRVQYERDGQPVEEQILSVVGCNESAMPALYTQPASQRRSCNARAIIIARAPQGHLDELMAKPEFKSIGKSLQANQEWSARLSADQQAAFQRAQAENNRQFQAIMQKGRDDNDRLLANGRAFQKSMKESTDRALANDRAQQAAIDASAHATVLHSLDQQEFRNPATGQIVQASSQYNHQWMSSDGSTLIQTNDHTLDPNGSVYPVSQSWTELVPK
jgi:hypothetical protein